MSIFHEVQDTPSSYVNDKYVAATYKNAVEPKSIGTTFRIGARTEQIMSDVWETAYFGQYFNVETNHVETITWIDSASEIDITEANKALLKAYLVERRVTHFIHGRENENAQINKGDFVKVTKGRKDIGLYGKVLYTKEMFYKTGYSGSYEAKLLIALDDETVEVEKYGKKFQSHVNTAWVWERNCEKQNVPVVTPEEIEAYREETAKLAFDYLVRDVKY